MLPCRWTISIRPSGRSMMPMIRGMNMMSLRPIYTSLFCPTMPSTVGRRNPSENRVTTGMALLIC